MFDLAIVLVLLVAAIVMFAINKPRLDAVALIMLVALPFTGVLTMGEALAGFSDPNIVLIAALFVLGDGLVRTGVAQRLGDWLIAKAGSSQIRLIVLLMVVVSALGATMSSTAVTAIFIPVALRIAKSTGVGPGRLMMPLSFAALISGMMTLVATAPNLVVNGELERHGIEGFRFFSFTPFGLPVLVLGIIYMSFAHRWLPDKVEAKNSNDASFAVWIEEYKLADREYRLRVTDRSSLVGKTLEGLNLRQTSGASILAVERNRKFSEEILRPTAKMELQADDILLIDLFAPHSSIEALRHQFALEELPLSGAYFTDRSQEIGMAEVLLLPTSDLVGRTVVEAGFRTQFGLSVIGLRRGVVAHERSLLNEALAAGDTLLLIGPWNDIEKLQSDNRDLVTHPAACRIRAGAPGPWQGAASADLPGARRRIDGQRPDPECAGRPDRMPADGSTGLHRPPQRLPFDRLENHRSHRRHVAVLDRPGENRWCGVGGRWTESNNQRRRTSRHARHALCHDCAARDVHLEYRYSGADGPGRSSLSQRRCTHRLIRLP